MSKDPAESPDVTVLVPAAGEGRRLGGTRKQFRNLGDAPLIVQTVRAFDRHPAITRLVVITLADEVSSVRRTLEDHGIRKMSDVVGGGSTRQESVGCGLHAVPESSDIVLVHDAVRPFVSATEIADVVRSSRVHGAASVAIPVVDTVRRASAGVFGATVRRDDLFQMQTPQGFTRAVLCRAHESASAIADPATDDVELAQMVGQDVYLVNGSSANFKITTADDWNRAQLIWPSWEAENRA